MALAHRLHPDVCLFDIRMPHLDGVEATRRLAGPDVADPLAVVVITTFDTDEYITGALRAGAKGFLLKDPGPDLLVQAVHAAAQGDALIAPSVTVRLLARFAESATSTPRAQPVVPLTEREEEVAVAVARGLTNAEIAAQLYISLSTVKFHVGSLMDRSVPATVSRSSSGPTRPGECDPERASRSPAVVFPRRPGARHTGVR